MKTKITQLFVILLSWLALPVGAQTYKMTTGTRVSLSDLTVGNNYAIFSTAISGTNTSGLAYAGYVSDNGNAIRMIKPGKLPKDFTPSAAEIWTLTAKEGSTVTFKNASTGRYISSNTSAIMSSAEASVKLCDYQNLPIAKMGSGESSVSDDGQSCINCANGDFTGANVYGIVTTDNQKGIKAMGNQIDYASFCYPFAFYQAVEKKTVITFNYVREDVTLHTTTETNVSVGKEYVYMVPNAFRGYYITSASAGASTATPGNELRFVPNETGNVVTVTLGEQHDIRDFKEITYTLSPTEITEVSQIQEGQKILIQIYSNNDSGGEWNYIQWSSNHQLGKKANVPVYDAENLVFTVTKAETSGDKKIVQIMGEDGYYLPALSSNSAITLGTAADYELIKEEGGTFSLKNGSKAVNNNPNNVTPGSVVSFDYGPTRPNQKLRLYAVVSSVAVSSIPLDVTGNPVHDGGKYAIRMPGRQSSIGPNRYLTGSAANSNIVQREAPFDNSLVWTLTYAPEGLILKSEANGNYAASFKFTDNGAGTSWQDGADKTFLTAATEDLAEVWFPSAQTTTPIAGVTYQGYSLKTTTGNTFSNYLSNHGNIYKANMGFYNNATDNGSIFQFVPTYNVHFVDQTGLQLETVINGITSPTGEFVMPHGGHYVFHDISFPTLSEKTMEDLFFEINGEDSDYEDLIVALNHVNDNMAITVKYGHVDYSHAGAPTNIDDKFNQNLITGEHYFLKMHQNAGGTTEEEIDANVAYQTKNEAGQIAPLAWNGTSAQVWRPYGTQKTIVLQNADNTYLKVNNYPTSGIGYGTSFAFDATLANATPFSAWLCDTTLIRYYLTSSKPDGSIYQYTSDVVNGNTAGLNTEVNASAAGAKMQFVPAVKLSFVVKDLDGNEYADPSITLNGVTFGKAAMNDIYVEQGKGISNLTITEAAGESANAYNNGSYRFFVGGVKVQSSNLSTAIATLTGDATIEIQKKNNTSPFAIDELYDVNGNPVEKNKPYRVQVVTRGAYFLTQVHNSDEIMASDALIANGKQHWYVEPSTNDSIKLFAANNVGYLSKKEDATGNNPAEVVIGSSSASASTKIETATSTSCLTNGSTFALRWVANNYYFDGANAATATSSENNYFTLLTASDTTFYLMRTSTARSALPSYIKKASNATNGALVEETTNISEAAPFVIQHLGDSTFRMKSFVNPADPTTYTYLDKKVDDATVPCFWKDRNGNPSVPNSPIKLYQILDTRDALNFAFSKVSEDEYIYTLNTKVNNTSTCLGNPGGTGENIGFFKNGGNVCQICFIPVSSVYDEFGQEIGNGSYRIEMPGRAKESGCPVTLTMNGGAGYSLSDREQYYINPQGLTQYRNYYWLSDIEQNVQYRNDSTQVWFLEPNGIEGVWIKNINGKYWKAERFEEGKKLVTDTVSNRENATLWAIIPVAVSGVANAYNLVAANDTIVTPTNWYFSNHGGMNSNMGFYNNATDAGTYFTFTPVRKIRREDAYEQGIINAYGFKCYGLGYKNTDYAPGDSRDSIQGYELPKNLWLPYNPISQSYSHITFHRPELIGYHYENGITETEHSDRIIRYTGYELNNYPIIGSHPPYKNKDGDWTFAENTRWYAITVRACDGKRANPYIMSQNFFRYVTMADVNTPFCDRFLFCFVGDSVNGYLVYNKAEGAGRYMGSKNADHICTAGERNIKWLPNDNTEQEKLYSKHLIQVTQHTQSGYYMLVDRYTNFSFDAYNPGKSKTIGWNCYWHARYQPNGAYIKNVLGTEEWTNGQTNEAASYEPSIYHTGGTYQARTMTFPALTEIYARAFNKEFFHEHVGYLGMHTHADSVELNFSRLNANLSVIGPVIRDNYATLEEYKAALLLAQDDSLAAYDMFLENLYHYGMKYDVRMAYKLVNEKTGRWLAVKGDNNDGPVTLTDVSDDEVDTTPGALWRFIEVDEKDVQDNSSMNNKYYKMHNIYRSANLKIGSDGSISLEPEDYDQRSSYGDDSGIGTNIDFVNDMRQMNNWAEYVIKPEGAEITGNSKGYLLSSTGKGVFTTDYDLGDSERSARWMMKGFALDTINLALPETAHSSTQLVYSSAVDPDKDFTWPYRHGLSAWRMTWRHDEVIRGQKIVPEAASNDRPFITAGTGILFRGPKDVKFPLLPCKAKTKYNSLLVSPDSQVEKDTIEGKPGFKLTKNSGFVIDYVNDEDIVRCCLIGSEEYKNSNYMKLDEGHVFLPKNKPYIPNSKDFYGSKDFTIALELEDEFGNITNIGTIDAEGNVTIGEYDKNAPLYDLQGRKVTNPIKGHIYIQNQRKIYFR
ncbi:MAG: hypothetical protein IJS43_05270 [Bacteroidaceae bacterium]|nr:hypothetical protein [Bacteroidaceae bacterium]